MKPMFVALLLLSPISGWSQQITFDRFFTDQTMRIDFYHSGNAQTEQFTPDAIYRYGTWAGNPDRCLQTLELGTYKVSVMDVATNTMIYSKNYSTIFAEYQTTGPAIKGESKTYHESVLIPGPRKPVLLLIEKRDRQNIPVPVFRMKIDPADYHIHDENKANPSDRAVQAHRGGDPHHCVDMVILGEGYTEGEFELFKKDLDYFTRLFFTLEPYKSRPNLFNITGLFSASAESGTDEPRQGVYRNTRFGSSFNAFDLDRYCLDDDNRSIRDVASLVPYDAILIMVNRDRYGGGGIYNWQTVFNTGSPRRDYVFLHEFGHAFAGLGDEYFSSPVSYEDFYTPGTEPLEANLTALLDPAHVKWEKFLSPGIGVPTEWGKARFDSLNNQVADLQAERANMTDKEYQTKIDKVNRELNDFINTHPLKDKVGVFEGANYMSKGMYRPSLMSMMHKFTDKSQGYGIVSEQAIIRVIESYTQP
jgi:hypothetical protein